MKNTVIYPATLSGELEIPPSKSICHRAIICAGLSEGISNIDNIVFSEDIEATCGAMEKLGADIKKTDKSLKIKGISQINKSETTINCSESGSTLRFMIPIIAAFGRKTTFIGKGELVKRPLKSYYDIFDAQKIKYENKEGRLPLTLEGKLKPGEFKINGNVSSQFISGLLLSLPLLDGDSKIMITTKLESKPYVDLTIDVLKSFSINVNNYDFKEFIIEGKQKYKASEYRVEGDFSQAAFWLAADLLGADIICSGLNIDSIQGDKAILNIIEEMGGKIEGEGNKIKSFPCTTRGITIDAAQYPDLVPILAVIAALSEGETQIVNAGRLRLKESDRLASISNELNKLGADIEERSDGLIIRGRKVLNGGVVDSWNDHRIAMALAVASLKCTEPVIIKNSDCVKKSYPNFWDHFKKVGGKIDEWDMGK